jgi:hypothetical protein
MYLNIKEDKFIGPKNSNKNSGKFVHRWLKGDREGGGIGFCDDIATVAKSLH